VEHRFERGVAAGLVMLAVAMPIIVWRLIGPSTGVLAAVLSLSLLFAAGRLLRSRHKIRDHAMERLQAERGDRARVIYVSLLDEAGNELPPDEAQRRLMMAQLNAGPRDTVIGIKEPQRAGVGDRVGDLS
jgi:hypothetical protein